MTKIFHTIESCVAAIALRSTRLRLTARNGLSAAAFALITLVAGAGASFSPTAQAIPVDINGTAMSGLWNIDAESGWGASVVHQYNIMFITIYTFDANRNPIWYAATRCVVAGTQRSAAAKATNYSDGSAAEQSD